MSDIPQDNLNDDQENVDIKNNEMNSEEKLENLKIELEKEKEKGASYEQKIKYLLADFANLKNRTEVDIQNKVNSITDGIILKFLGIYDDFVRARDSLSKQKINTTGLDAILKNMDSFLNEFDVKSIEAVGEIFDPKLHEAISIKKDQDLDDDTITSEIRKGYILKGRVIRPSLVEISKKKSEMNING